MAKTPLGIALEVSKKIVKLVSAKGITTTRLGTGVPLKNKLNSLPKPTRRQFLWGGGAAAALAGGAYYRGEIADAVTDLISGVETNLDGTYSVSEVPAELRRLNERGIFLYSWSQGYNETGTVDAAGRTTLMGMRKDVWATVEQLLEDLDLLDQADSAEAEEAIVVTGLAEGAGHSTRSHGHGNGYSVDFRINAARRIRDRLIEDTTVTNRFTRELHPNHRLRESGLVVGEQIFRFNSKYFLFGVKHGGQVFVCYFDAESSHSHMEMIPWEDYNVDSQAEFVLEAQLPHSMRGIWRQEVRDYIRG